MRVSRPANEVRSAPRGPNAVRSMRFIVSRVFASCERRCADSASLYGCRGSVCGLCRRAIPDLESWILVHMLESRVRHHGARLAGTAGCCCRGAAHRLRCSGARVGLRHGSTVRRAATGQHTGAADSGAQCTLKRIDGGGPRVVGSALELAAMAPWRDVLSTGVAAIAFILVRCTLPLPALRLLV